MVTINSVGAPPWNQVEAFGSSNLSMSSATTDAGVTYFQALLYVNITAETA